MVLAALLLPALLLSLIAAGTGVVPGDVLVTRMIQQGAPAELGGLFVFVNDIGTTEGGTLVTLALGTLVVLRLQPAALVLMLATLPLRPLSGWLKSIAESPRPTADLVRITEHAGGFGFPSGHVLGATLLYGALLFLAPSLVARRALRWLIQIAAVAMIVLTGISRVYVGAHWPSDVIGGYLWGSIALITLIWTWHLATDGAFRTRTVETPATMAAKPQPQLQGGD
jgi:undecaprenyl-diphosphatase